MHYKYIAVEGNIGAGKTTLSSLLANHYHANLVLEAFADNVFLPKFYSHPTQHAYLLETSFLLERYKQMSAMLMSASETNIANISDYLFVKCKLFAKINLQPDEYALFEDLYNILSENVPQPDLLIYLQSPIEHLQKNIQTRARSYEKNIANYYLQQLQNSYNHYVENIKIPTLVINSHEVDFIAKPENLVQLLQYLEKEYGIGLHYLTF